VKLKCDAIAQAQKLKCNAIAQAQKLKCDAIAQAQRSNLVVWTISTIQEENGDVY